MPRFQSKSDCSCDFPTNISPLPVETTGQSKEEIAKSPFLEKLLKKDYEVIYFTEVLDEYVMQHMVEYDDKKFADASKDDLKLREKDEKESRRDKVRPGGVIFQCMVASS